MILFIFTYHKLYNINEFILKNTCQNLFIIYNQNKFPLYTEL